MRIKQLELLTSFLEEELHFYSVVLGLPVVSQQPDEFSIQVGWTTLTFKRSRQHYNYHYCFLIPSNKLTEALAWMEKHTAVIEIEDGRKIQHFDSWNADSFYFYDASGNLAECIVRYDLKNESESPFDQKQLLCVNEIGMPSRAVESMNSQLEQGINTQFWKGDLQRFGTNGDQEGLFLIPDYSIKKAWFPTTLPTQPSPFNALIANGGTTHRISFANEQLNMVIFD